MANRDIFGIERKKRLSGATGSGMASEIGEEMIGRKVASGEVAKEAGEAVAKSALGISSEELKSERLGEMTRHNRKVESERVERDVFGNVARKKKDEEE